MLWPYIIMSLNRNLVHEINNFDDKVMENFISMKDHRVDFYFRKDLYVIAKGTTRACLIIVNHVYLLTYVAWIIVIYPLKILGCSDLFYSIEGQMMLALLRMVSMWNEFAGYQVLEGGDDITPCLEERTLVLVNHQSAVDAPMLFNAFIGRNQILPNTMWIMDNFIKYSTAGVVSIIRKDFFICQGKEKRMASLEKLSEHIRNWYLPLRRKWLILFPEGGFLYKRKETSQRYGRLNNLPHLEHVTIPRVGAFNVIMNGLNIVKVDTSANDLQEKHLLKYVLDVTIGYPNGEPLSFSNLLLGNHSPCQIIIFYRLFSIETIPKDEKGLSEWLLSRWVEKEKLLEEFYRTGNFPLEANAANPKPVKQNFISFCGLHVVFLIATFVQFNIFRLIHQYWYTWWIFSQQ